MIKFTIFWIIIGLLTFTCLATFEAENWQRAYALWDKGKDCLLLYLAWQGFGRMVLPILVFVGIRFIWDIISWITGIGINNSYAVGVFFLIYLAYVCYKTIRHVRN